MDFSNHTQDMSPFTDIKAQKCTYKLQSVIYHQENSMHEGYYSMVTKIGGESGDWWQCRDGEVSQSSFGRDGHAHLLMKNHKQKAHAYLTSYKRIASEALARKTVGKQTTEREIRGE